MWSKLCNVFVRLLLFVSCTNARAVMMKSHLPGSRMEIENLATSVCNDLEFTFPDEATVKTCKENFFNTYKYSSTQPEVKVRCRTKTNLQIETAPSDSWQVVVLLPDSSEEDGLINYSLIAPNTRFNDLSVYNPSGNYVIFTSVLNKDGRPSVWYREGIVPAWDEASIPSQRNYNVQILFKNYSTIHEKNLVTGIISWNHTGDSDVCFEFSNHCKKSRGRTMKVWPDKQQRIVIENLHLGDHCEVQIKGMYGTTNYKYHTPAMDAYDKNLIEKESINKSLPEIPKNISLSAVEDGDDWQVTVGWLKPLNPPDKYNVSLRIDSNIIVSMVVPGNATEVIFNGVDGEGLYYATVSALKGVYKGQDSVRAYFPARIGGSWASVAGVAWGSAAAVILALALCWMRLRMKIYEKRIPKGIDSKPLDSALETITAECEDQWEVKVERLLLHEVIGEGAFGVVRRGSLAPQEKDVAVKMLKDFPSLDEVRAFRLEMELMKSVGAHPHVVSLVGCCSGKRPLIIAEYCARGDLLSFLRCSWDVMVSKRNAKYYNNNIESSDYRNDLFKCKIQREHSRLVVNKMYDLQGCDTDLTSLDLLSFCRQIAMGMEFLASNRLVHRDLAARNVLVTGDKTLKIADFGLSRDVYEENQYKQKGNGKMPVKWMALESLTRRIYTSQSDVWSFGVVVWEVVTVGGSPYPDVPAARLPRLLRAGYRMPRPPNCSKQLYELMVSCWRAHPRSRPTFSELHARLDALLATACAHPYLCLELDDPPAPAPRAARYFKMIMRGKRAWTRETYERPLKALQGNHNHYTSTPVILSPKAPVCRSLEE